MSKKVDDRAARTAALIEQQRKKERARMLVIGAIAVAVVAVVVGLTVVLANRDTTGDQAQTPSGLTGEFGVVLGDDGAPVSLTFYEDPQCPICSDFEGQVGDQVAEAVAEGKAKVEYRVVSFLDPASGNEYSSRAANAAMAVLDTAGAEAFATFHTTLFENQPAEGTDGPDDDQLIAWAVEAGAPEAEVKPQIEDKVYEQWITNATDQMSKDGVNGTPGVFIDGQQVDPNSSPVQPVLDALQ